jgi:hypothetical protein
MYYDRALFVRVFVVAYVVVSIFAVIVVAWLPTVMDFDRTLSERVAVVLFSVPGAIITVWMAWMALWTGKAWVRGRDEPYTRENEPIRYWIWTTFAAIFAAVAVSMVVSIGTVVRF